MAGKVQTFTTMTTRQKVMTGIFILIVLVLLWQVYKLFGATKGTSRPVVATAQKPGTQTRSSTASSGAITPTASQPGMPQQTQLIKTEAPVTTQDAFLLKQQQETQVKYLAAVSELQMLRVARDIAQTNQAIMTARLSAVTSQKKIVDMLSPPQPVQPPQPYSSTLVSPIPTTRTTTISAENGDEVKYVVISVAQLQNRWSAVLGAKGILYNVHIGDVLPIDNARVTSIDRSGVILQKNGVRRKISLVPII